MLKTGMYLKEHLLALNIFFDNFKINVLRKGTLKTVTRPAGVIISYRYVIDMIQMWFQ